MYMQAERKMVKPIKSYVRRSVQPAFLWVLSLWFVILGVISLGALTRLLDAGLGCPDWPGCYGWLMPPVGQEHINLAHELFPSWPVEQTKAWMEMIHRYFATGLGFAIILQIVFLKNHSALERLLSWVMLGLVCLQGAFGAWTVTMKLWPPVVTGHLVGGFFLLMVQSWLLIHINRTGCCKTQDRPLPADSDFIKPIKFRSEVSNTALSIPLGLKRVLYVATILLILQVILGGWTSSQYAGLVCPDFPTCQGKWWPESIQHPWAAPWPQGQEALGGLLGMADRMAIQMAHRYIAGLLLVAECLLIIGLLRYRPELRYWILAVAFTLTIQISVGIANVFFHLPLSLALMHNIGAALLWGCHWMMIARLTNLKEPKHDAPRVWA
jgi:cytochrome c oxidase assembly protein subunit 15